MIFLGKFLGVSLSKCIIRITSYNVCYTKLLRVSKIYDNGDIEAVSDFKVDTTAFTSSTPGVYPVKINTFNGEATLNVTVREKKEYEWKTTIFGQSRNNFV